MLSEKLSIDVDTQILKTTDISDLSLTETTWKFSYDIRHEIKFKNKSFSEIVQDFLILTTKIAPDLVIMRFIILY